jgi:hypothetical protein
LAEVAQHFLVTHTNKETFMAIQASLRGVSAMLVAILALLPPWRLASASATHPGPIAPAAALSPALAAAGSATEGQAGALDAAIKVADLLIKAVTGAANFWPKGKEPGDNSLEYIYYGSAGSEEQCPLVVYTLHDNNKWSQELIASQPDTNLHCPLNLNAHIRPETMRGFADVEPAKINTLSIVATGPASAKFSKLVLRLGGNLQSQNFGNQSIIVLDPELVSYCRDNADNWKGWASQTAFPSLENIQNRGLYMSMDTNENWQEIEFWNVGGFIAGLNDLMDLGSHPSSLVGVDKEIVDAKKKQIVDGLCNDFGPKVWSEKKTCTSCCSFTQHKKVRTVGNPNPHHGDEPLEREECSGPLLQPLEKDAKAAKDWAPNW